jgi:hypothetical protein
MHTLGAAALLELCGVGQVQLCGFDNLNTLRNTVVRSGVILLVNIIANIYKLLDCLQKKEQLPEVMINSNDRMTPTRLTDLLGVYRNQQMKITARF